MKDLQRRMERFFFRNRDKGIPNLMLYIAIGNVLVYIVDAVDPSHILFYALGFSPELILRGQVWRLFTYVFLSGYGSGLAGPFILLLMMFLFYRIGRIIENRCGILKFNLFYLSGILIIDVAAMFTHWYPTADTFHYSLLLAFATLCPNDMMLLFFIIPIKMKYLAIVYFVLVGLSFIQGNFLPVCAILNYLIFFGGDIKNMFPSLGYNRQKPVWQPKRSGRTHHTAPSPNWADNYRSKDGKRPYRHKCTVCGRTDTDHPELEFRYCSRCNGFYCYCIEHINNHVHIQ